jgi:glycosyltransferase involved in cell wall biosynthesis
MTTLPIVSIILPIRNEARHIAQSMESILAQDYLAELTEILITDGMSSDDTRARIGKFIQQHPNRKIYILDNPGKIVPTGMNIALRQAKGEVIIRIDGHCIIAPDYVSKCVWHIKNNQVDGVGGPMASRGETMLARLIALGMSSPFGVGNSAFRTTTGKTMLVDTVPFPAYTREIIKRAGFYDEELTRNQDDEYNYRIRKLGGKILLADDVRSTYFSRTSLKGLWRQYYQYGLYKVRVLQKHPRQMSLRQFVPPAFVLGLLLSALITQFPFSSLILHPSSFIPILYLSANLIASACIATKHGWKYLPLLPLVFAILHISYGLGFLAGLFKFWTRWGDKTGKTPAPPQSSTEKPR